jgi:hypothetical protein
LSECKLLRELDPFSREPKLSTDDFLCAEAEPGVDGDESELSASDGTAGTTVNRRDAWAAGLDVMLGDAARGPLPASGGWTFIDCDDDRRKNGIELGVSRLDVCRRTEDDGLSGASAGSGPPP